MARESGRKRGMEPAGGRRTEGGGRSGRSGFEPGRGRQRGSTEAAEIPITGSAAESGAPMAVGGGDMERTVASTGASGTAEARAAEEGGTSEGAAAEPFAESAAAEGAAAAPGREGGEERRRRERRQNWGALAPRMPTHPSLFSLGPLDVLSASPFELMRRFSEEMDRAFEGLGGWSGRGGRAAWSPAVEAFERENEFVVRAELPGLRKEDLRVEVTDQGVIIEGERRHEQEERREGFYRSERSYGRFSRVVPLPYENVDVEKARAEFRDGVLEVALPIPRGQRRRRRIEIGAGGGGTGRGSERGQA